MKNMFQNLPNNLIMNIIKMAEDQRKQEQMEQEMEEYIYSLMFDHPNFFIEETNHPNNAEEVILRLEQDKMEYYEELRDSNSYY